MQEDRFINRALALFEANLSNPDFGVTELSRELHYSRQQLYNKIKKQTKLSPRAWMTRIRLEKAKALLLHTDQPVAAIARAVGFASPSSFSVAFKRRYARSPQAFRKAQGGL